MTSHNEQVTPAPFDAVTPAPSQASRPQASDGSPRWVLPALAALIAGNYEGKERITLTHIPGNKHAMLTAHFIEGENSPTQAVLDDIIAYFREKLSDLS